MNFNKLTEREIALLELVKGGYSTKEIADRLNISPHTVKAHMGSLHSKLDIEPRFTILQGLARQARIEREQQCSTHEKTTTGSKTPPTR